ncbi:cytochrome C [Algoriphagus namhaensis]|uniref:Cytochrome C n=1 Tax=Algoriphagus namhaensis TaxID=915353 RepID=A0ABV8ALS5_9BACT
MKKFLKILGLLASLLIVIIISGAIYLTIAFPKVSPAQDLKIEYTAERIAHGKYLANHVVVCMDCHSTRDYTYFSAPLVEGTLGKGGETFNHDMGFPGTFYSLNITPFGIADYTDGELYRVITTGVTNEGRAIFPVMPYPYYGQMDPEDVYSIISYIRTLPPIDSEIPESKADFPVSLILKTIPHDPNPQKRPNPTDQVAYGAYLVNQAACKECHTPVDSQGGLLPGKDFSGGRTFGIPGGALIASSNITSDESTGIGNWTEATFVARFKEYQDPRYLREKVAIGDFNSIMPWIMYSGMKEEDLKAIYAYLQTLEPISNQVTRFTPMASLE